MEKRILRKVRSEYGKQIRKGYENHTIQEKRSNMTEYEARDDGISNTLTTVAKDNLLLIGVKQATRKGYIECRAGGGSRPILSHKRAEKRKSARWWRYFTNAYIAEHGRMPD